MDFANVCMLLSKGKKGGQMDLQMGRQTNDGQAPTRRVETNLEFEHEA